jgi:uncharacterized protein (TIRG00374 family)
MKKAGQVSVSLGLTLLIGYIFYRAVPDWGHALSVMVRGRPVFLLVGFGFVLLHMVLRAIRWGVLLAPVKRKIALRNLFSLTLVKYVINIIPPRTGEVVASILLARKERISAASVIAASLLERILDTGTVVVMFGVYLVSFSQWYPPVSERGMKILQAVRSFSMKGFLVLCILFLILAGLLRSECWTERIPPRIRKYILLFLEGFRALQQGGALAKTLALSVAIWLVITCQVWFMVQAYLAHFPFTGSLFLMCITVVGIAIPTPGGVGGYQIFMNVALVNFFSNYLSAADPNSQAAGISNGCYLVSMIPVILIGLAFLYREGLSLGQVSQISEQEEKEQPPASINPR